MNNEVIPESAQLRDAVAAIERGRKTIAVLVDASGKLVGTITDGDVRRAILRGLRVESPARDIATLNPVTAFDGTRMEDIAHLLLSHGLEAIPIVDAEGHFVRTVFIDNVTNLQGGAASATSIWGVIIMAGGEGRRMLPYTKSTPKPMLLVGGMPLMERNIRALIRLGVRRFFLSINYLGHVIEQHFGDGGALGAQIEYLRETEPLGTGGAIRLLGAKPQGPVLVMNGDLLTGLDVSRLLTFHVEHAAHITVAAKEYIIEVPFGVLHMDGELIDGLIEKPSERFLCNAGIYALSPEVFDDLPQQKHFNMTMLIQRAYRTGKKVVAFPTFELWKDVGTPQQLFEARSLVELGQISAI